MSIDHIVIIISNIGIQEAENKLHVNQYLKYRYSRTRLRSPFDRFSFPIT